MKKNALVMNSEIIEMPDGNSAWVQAVISNIDLADGEELKNLQNAVGGLVQPIDLTPTITMWCNEEGKYNGSSINFVATKIWERFFGRTDIIMGQVIFTGGSDDEGATMPLSEEDEKSVKTWISESA
jgi:hypothetical protein